MIENRKLEQRVLDLFRSIDDMTQITVAPSIFSDDIYGHDCDMCRWSELNMGDVYDSSVCVDCWEQAIHEAFKKEVK